MDNLAVVELCLSLGSLVALQPVPRFKAKLLLLLHTLRLFLPPKKTAPVPPPFRLLLSHSIPMARAEGTSGDTRCPPNLLWAWFLIPNLSSAIRSPIQGFIPTTRPF